jgi:hypothetical protein
MTSSIVLSSAPFVMQAPLSDDDRALLQALENKVNQYRNINRLLKAYYEGERWLVKLGFSIPPKMRDFQTVIGWPSIVVDVIEERLKWKGWYDLDAVRNNASANPTTGTISTSDNQSFFDDLYTDNNLEAEAPMVHLDSLIFGCGFVAVGTRDPEDLEKTPLITTESTELTTGTYDPQKRRLTAGVAFRTDDAGNIVRATLMKPDENIYLRRLTVGGYWIVEDKDEHNLQRVPLVPFINRPMGSRRSGRSEITRTIRGYTDIGIRTLLGMETNREFYSAPQRYVLGASEDDFRDAAGNKIPGWQAVLGRIWGIPRNDDGELPEVGQWDPAPSRPYLEQIQGLAQLVAADGAVPQTYLGFMSDNPASADSIRALESRLIKRSERRITSFGRSWGEVGLLAWIMKNKSRNVPKVDTDWGNPATPTMQADADWAVKLISVDVMPPTSTVARNRLGLSKTEQAILDQEVRAAEAKARVDAQRQMLQQAQMMQRFGQNGGPGVSGSTNGPGGGANGNNPKPPGGAPSLRPTGGRVAGQRDYPRG